MNLQLDEARAVLCGTRNRKSPDRHYFFFWYARVERVPDDRVMSSTLQREIVPVGPASVLEAY